MISSATSLPADLADWADGRIAQLEEHGLVVVEREVLRRVLCLSDYAFEQLRRHPEWSASLSQAPETLGLDPALPESWSAALRRFRHRHSVAIVAREAEGGGLDATLRHSSWLADHCCLRALEAVHGQMRQAHGPAGAVEGEGLPLCVFGLGKLGGGELNFSSDIDLVFAYAESGDTAGPRVLDHETYFQRIGQRLIQLLGEVTAEGFGFRVDMRLRPFGQSGRLVPSFNAMEQYYQREGRDWERYAWIKARALDPRAGGDLLETLRPFIYRRYLDYTAIDGLRAMKAMIEAEVQRRDLQDHLKLGPGGIREVEFMVQLQQLIRGGREASLRTSGTLPAMYALAEAGYLEATMARRLEQAYRLLRMVENRIQMLRDEQVHDLPEDDFLRRRLAAGLGYPEWPALAEALESARALVRAEFAKVFESRRGARDAGQAAMAQLWDAACTAAQAAQPMVAEVPEAVTEAMRRDLTQLAQAAARAGLSAAARARLDRLVPALFTRALQVDDAELLIGRAVRLLLATLRRPSYLALLDEQPAALQRLVDVFAASGLLADQVVEHPLLLDDLLDARVDLTGRNLEAMAAADAARGHDPEQVLLELNELRRSVGFRLALGYFLGRNAAADTAAQLADLAEAVLRNTLALAVRSMVPVHGSLPGHAADAGIAVVGYGSLGGRELGFASDLDLVFLTDSATAELVSDGTRPLDAPRYQQRLMQKMLALMSTLTPAGRLYEADLRLRPDGAKGLLLCSLQSFADYQHARAWSWEHQALVRARPVAGSETLCRDYDAVRREVLSLPRARTQVCHDVAGMRARMRAELDRGRGERFDLKQGVGGLVDLEFLLQAMVLSDAQRLPGWLDASDTPGLLACLRQSGLLPDAAVADLQSAHATLLDRALRCTLHPQPRVVQRDADIDAARRAIRAAWLAFGMEGAEDEAR
ncbi:MAG: bifunctional [glutamate--ammonia ligase]-adenylyl-L-tyrosine phosphorylase/[glutamate--ammonia-ligase] adenylyltransferase [Xanthomonadales bacterium]|nr:bifunctional [glutamate--ammonia ligase]-adenylyl-L-tyrosine phosphorylase/[glutamate--ammonia-ligase] adenylyltransferase [Xanthomonadales bacterium]